MRAFLVIVTAPEGVPIIGELARVSVEANTHAHATLIARGMRARMGWPRGSRYTPRLTDTTSYAAPVALVVLEHPEALGTW